jgi:formate/nitrite transporter FocA (FNT family)
MAKKKAKPDSVVQFFFPTLLGNVIGGLALVAALVMPEVWEGKDR